MKNFILLIIISIFLYTNAIAGPTYSGKYIGTFKGNDSNSLDDIETFINDYFLYNNIKYKTDIKRISKLKGYESDKPGEFSFTWVNEKKEGKWYSNDPVNFYSVKGGSQYALYWMDLYPVFEGLFSTQHLKNGGGKIPDLSHITIYTNNNVYDKTQITPEPSTMMLFGIGLMTFLFYRREI